MFVFVLSLGNKKNCGQLMQISEDKGLQILLWHAKNRSIKCVKSVEADKE